MHTILITGGAGFIGSHLADMLLARGDRVLALDDLSTGSTANVAHLRDQPRFTLVHGDVADAAVLEPLVAQCDAVVHLAAAVGVELVLRAPVAMIGTNVGGTDAVLRAAQRHGRRVLLASTSEVYGKSAQIPFREDGDLTLGPPAITRWSYACSKLLDEFLALAYHREHGLSVTIARFFNTVGPRQTGRYGMVVPRFVRAALHNEPLIITGDGAQTRCFCHVFDTAAAVVALLDTPAAVGQVVNIGNPEEISIRALAERVVAQTGSRSDFVFQPYASFYGPGFADLPRRVPDITRLITLTGLQPQRTLDTILHDVIAYERHEPFTPAPALGAGDGGAGRGGQ